MKKTLLACCMMIVTSLAWAQDKLPGNPAVVPSTKGEVLEVTDVDNFTYLLLKTPNGETWAAVRKAPVKKGDTVTVENATVMTNFESRTLKKSFPAILFGSLAGAPGGAAADHSMAAAHAGAAKPEIDLANISVPKASGANARTVAEINTQSAARTARFRAFVPHSPSWTAHNSRKRSKARSTTLAHCACASGSPFRKALRSLTSAR